MISMILYFILAGAYGSTLNKLDRSPVFFRNDRKEYINDLQICVYNHVRFTHINLCTQKSPKRKDRDGWSQYTDIFLSAEWFLL